MLVTQSHIESTLLRKSEIRKKKFQKIYKYSGQQRRSNYIDIYTYHDIMARRKGQEYRSKARYDQCVSSDQRSIRYLHLCFIRRNYILIS